MFGKNNQIEYADDSKESIGRLFILRIPPLIIGLILGIGLSFVTSSLEKVITKNVEVAFFIPFIVYIADAVGTQTQNIYIRSLKTGKASFKKYFVKESIFGTVLGLIFGLVVLTVVFFWFKSIQLALAIALSVFMTIALAPIVALIVTEIFELEHTDPAVGSGPITTIIQDAISIVIYGIIISALIV